MFFDKLTESDIQTFLKEKLNTETTYIHFNNQTGKLRFTHLVKRPNFHYENQCAVLCDRKMTLIPTYDVIDKKFQEIEASDEYKDAETKFNEFIEKNKLMDESTIYYLTKEEEDADKISEEEILDDDFFDDELDEEIQYIDIPEESFVIDTVIQNLENRYPNDYNSFLEYKQLFEKLLENEDYILFSCIWNEPEKMLIKSEVNINNIKIEDLANLEFNQMLKIYK